MTSKIQLNKNQKEAVEHDKGALLVVAGAGTGKTRVITERIRYLLNTKKALSDNILALTFTEKASQEMLERVDEVMPLGYSEPWIYTFHSFADRILRVEGLEIGLDPSFKIMPYTEQWLLIRQNLFSFDLDYFRPLGNPAKFISAMLKFISRLQDENISLETFTKFAQDFEGDKGATEEKLRWLELANFYQKYSDLKLAHSKMDFGDLITWTVKLFAERPNILKKYRAQFSHILVDEFQDTNIAQYEIVKQLFPLDEAGDRSLLVVGDDSQSIYKFRGAAVSNILRFQDDYPKAEMVTLLENYRSNQAILDAAYSLIKNNNPDTLESKLGISKELVSTVVTEQKAEPQAIQLKTLEDEADYVVSQILELVGKEPQLTYKDIAILARANNHLDPFIFALRRYGIPYQLVSNRGLYDREEIRDILALLRVVINPHDTLSLYRTLNIDSLIIPPGVISKILSETKFKKIPMWEVAENYEDDSLSFLRQKIKDFQDQITKLAPTEFVHQIVLAVNYLKPYLAEETVENKLSINNLNKFLDIVKSFEISYRSENNEIPTIVEFVSYLDLMLEAGENPAQAEIEDIDTVKLLTVHASKGLEFPIVFMVNLVANRFPTRNRRDTIEIPEELIVETLPEGDAHLQEERRLFYVGMTRAQKHLYLVCAKDYGGTRDKNPSGYIAETGLNLKYLENYKEEINQESLFGHTSEFRQAKATKVDSFVPWGLSYSQINTYKTCPLQYKYRYVLNIPTPPNHALSFGTTIHDTLRDFHQKFVAGQKPSFLDLQDMYAKNWQPLGYDDADHRQARYASGIKLLEDYYEKNKDPKSKPIALEKSFTIKIDGTKFFGRIDRIDKNENGEVELVDYKTGSLKTQKEVDKDDQMSIYALAAKEAFNINLDKLSLYFVEHGVKLTTTRTQEDMEETRDEIVKVVKQIKSADFEATPGMHCNWCDFKEICPFAFKG